MVDAKGLATVLLLCCALAISLLVADSVGRRIETYVDAREWTKTQATIQDLQLHEHPQYGDDGARTGSTYICHVKYGYTANGLKRISNAIDIWGTNGNRALCDFLASRKKTSCYYNPIQDTESVLDRNLHIGRLARRITLSFMGGSATAFFAAVAVHDALDEVAWTPRCCGAALFAQFLSMFLIAWTLIVFRSFFGDLFIQIAQQMNFVQHVIVVAVAGLAIYLCIATARLLLREEIDEEFID